MAETETRLQRDGNGPKYIMVEDDGLNPLSAGGDGGGCGCWGCLIFVIITLALLVAIKYLWQALWA